MMIKFLKKAFWFPFSSKNQIEKYQTEARDIEWNSFREFIPKKSNFLDVGCGAGDNLNRAESELNCEITGIDPSPGAHGVGRFSSNDITKKTIIQGSAENLPFEDETFDVVFCSHVLEHVTNTTKSLSEISRVLKKDGTIIIGMPTASMAFIALISHFLFTTHVNVLFFIKKLFTKEVGNRFLNIFIPYSHSYPNKRFIFHDLNNYRITRWKSEINKQFVIKEIITPCLYPYPDYLQWFPKLKVKGFSSSVFFICSKK